MGVATARLSMLWRMALDPVQMSSTTELIGDNEYIKEREKRRRHEVGREMCGGRWEGS